MAIFGDFITLPEISKHDFDQVERTLGGPGVPDHYADSTPALRGWSGSRDLILLMDLDPSALRITAQERARGP